MTFDAGLWAAILGSTPYTLRYTGSYPGGTPYRITSTNIASGNAAMTTTATVRYDYTPHNPIAPVPGPLPLVGAGAAWGWSRRLRRRLNLAAGPTPRR